ncbi:hypothetical protein CspHIS471_0606180 [Cutaneotrichosporon sp. HIS471]|nr:hypothetical protein CspHIS471_0606180 [Cutaneotrichosporon sp. HIS471]
MKYFAAAAVLASVAVAQLDPSTINPCILTCATTGATAAGCSGVTDLACICASAKFITGALDCINAQCPDQVAAATALQGTLCAGQGSPSAAASGSETPAASAAETTSAAETSASAAASESAAAPAGSSAAPAASSAASAAGSAAASGSAKASSAAASVSSKASSAAASASSAAATPKSAAGALTIPAKEVALAVFGVVAGAGLLL